MPSKALFLVIALASLLSQLSYAQERCVTDFSGKRSKSLRSTKLHKSGFFADVYAAPFVQLLKNRHPAAITDFGYGGNVGVIFPKRVVFGMGVSHYRIRGKSEGQERYPFDASFIELTAQLKYYFRERGFRWYPFIAFTASGYKLHELAGSAPAGHWTTYTGRYYYNFFCMSFGAGIEKDIWKILSAYGEAWLTPPASINSLINYYSQWKVSLGLRLKI